MSDAVATNKSRGALGGGSWTAIERVVSQAGQMIVFISAARFLTPAEFGIFALISACAILLMRAAEGGWAAYIMAWTGDRSVLAQVLGVALLSGLLAGAIGGSVALALPGLGFSKATAAMVGLFSIWIVLAVTSSAQKGILIWQRRLKTSALLEIGAEIVGILAAIWGLFHGLGVFALIVGRLSYQIVHVVSATVLTRVLPRVGLRGERLRDLLRVSWHIFLVRMISTGRTYAGTFVIGAFLGPASVGFYRAAERLVAALVEVVGQPANILAWSLFREVRNRAGGTTDGFQEEAAIFFPVLLGLSLPVFLWVAIMSQDIVTGILGPEWLPSSQLVALLAIAGVITLPGSVTEPVLTLAGEIKRLPPLSIFFLIITLASVTAFAPFGLIPLAMAQVAISVVITLSVMWLLKRYAAIDWLGFLPRVLRLAIPATAAAVVLLVLRDGPWMAEWHALLRAVAVIPPTGIVYCVIALAVEPELRRAIRNLRS